MDLPRPPDDPEVKNIIDKLAQFVARNGPEFEAMTKQKQEGNPKFSFLFGGEFYNYYNFKVTAEQQIMRNRGGGPPPLMAQQTGPPHWQHQQQPGPPGVGNNWGPGSPGPMGGGPGPGPGWGHQWSGDNMGPRGGGMGHRGGPNMNDGHNDYGDYGNGDGYGGCGDYGGGDYGSPHMGRRGMDPRGDNGGGFGRFDNPNHGFGRFDAGPPDLPNRGRSILGAPPLMNSMNDGCLPSRPPPLMQQTPQPVKPNTEHLETQITSLQDGIKLLKDQIVQSESNLTAQWAVLQQQQRAAVDDGVNKAKESQLEEQSRSCNIRLSELENVLQPIIESCTKDSISSGKSWIFQHGTNFNSNQVIADYLAMKATQDSASFNQKLHLIYLVNDVLHHCVRKNADALKAALETVAVPMYCAAADIAEEEDMKKLTKLMSLWESKNKFFSEEKLNDMKNPSSTMKKYRSKVSEEFAELVEPHEKTTTAAYNGYKQQHEQFVDHASRNVEQQQQQLDEVQQQLDDINGKFEAEMQTWQNNNPAQAAAMGGGGRRSRWDRTAAMGSSDSGPLGLPDITKPPPMMSTPPPAPKVPNLPYFELPAGLMVPLVKMEDSGYKPLDSSLIRLPPPQPPNERLLAAVDLFYAPPSHERPRDPEGWERLGLYEWSREKQIAMKKKADDIADGVRSASPPLSPVRISRENTPEQEVPEKEEKPKKRKRYRSRSRTRERDRTRSRERERTRSRSASRGSTPERRNRYRSRSRSRSRNKRRSRKESERSHGRGRNVSRSRSRSNERSRSGSPDGNYSLPSFLTRRSPTPPGGQLGQSNKGHQMLQKMGWKGSGLGTQESGIVEPVSGGDVRDKQDQYMGMGVEHDAFENFRRQKAGGFYTRMKGLHEARKAERH